MDPVVMEWIPPKASIRISQRAIRWKPSSPTVAMDKSIIIDNGDGIVNRDVPVDLCNVDRANIRLVKVDAVGTEVPIPVVDLSGCKGDPGHMGFGMNPAYISGPPINLSCHRGYPEPSNGSGMSPSSIMIGSPAPRFIRDPDIIPTDPRPLAYPVGSPLCSRDDGRGPDLAVLFHIDPFPVTRKITGVTPKFLRKVSGSLSAHKDSFVPLNIPVLPIIARTQGSQVGIRSLPEREDAACLHRRFSAFALDIDSPIQHRDIGVALFGHVHLENGPAIDLDG